MSRLLLPLLLVVALAAPARAQVASELKTDKRVYAPGEPVMLTISVKNMGKTPTSFDVPGAPLAGVTIWHLGAEKLERIVEGGPMQSTETRDLAPDQAWEAKVDVTGKLTGGGAYQFGWKGPIGGEAKQATCAIWTPEEVAALEDTVVVLTLQQDKTVFAPIGIGLEPRRAPLTVANFVMLAKKGFYTKTNFHRIIAKFMMQGGDPSGMGNGNAGYKVAGEFSDAVKHERGIVSMARESSPDSASCQFFICFGAAPHLDGAYTAYGKVLWGFETLDQVEVVMTDHHTMKGKCGVNHRDMPLEDVKIIEVKVGPRAELAPAKDGKGG